MWPKADDIRARCGPYQIRAVLRERGREVQVEELYLTETFRARDWSVPWHMGHIFSRYGVRSRTRFWFRASFAAKLAQAIEHGPVLFVINSIQGDGCLHWISARGYDASTDEFLCYDSQYESADNDWGNIRYSASRLLAALPWYGTFTVILDK